MRYLFLTVLVLCSVVCFSQAPRQLNAYTHNTQVNFLGTIANDSGFVFRHNFPDTTTANLGWIKNIPFVLVIVNDTLRMRNSAADAWITVGSGSGGGGSGVNIYNADSSLASDRTVDMNGKVLRFSVNGEYFLNIDPTLNSERTWMEAFNSGGLNKGFSEVRSTDVDAHFRLLADFHDGDAQATILGQSESGASSIIYTADTHTFAGDSIVLTTPKLFLTQDVTMNVDTSSLTLSSTTIAPGKTLLNVVNLSPVPVALAEFKANVAEVYIRTEDSTSGFGSLLFYSGKGTGGDNFKMTMGYHASDNHAFMADLRNVAYGSWEINGNPVGHINTTTSNFLIGTSIADRGNNKRLQVKGSTFIYDSLFAGKVPVGATTDSLIVYRVSDSSFHKIDANRLNGYVTTAVDMPSPPTGSNYTIEVTATGKTVTLPTAVGITGRKYTIKLTAIGSCTVATTSSQNIDASTTYSLSAQYKYVTVQSNNVGWLVIANN